MNPDKREVMNYYEELYEQGKSWEKREYYDWIVALMGQIAGYKILDVGCGGGDMFGSIKDKKAAPYGIDISLNALKIAKDRMPDTMLVFAPAEKIPFKSCSFDYTICSGVLEHVFNEEESLFEMKRVTKEGGKLILVVPNKYWLGRPLEKLLEPLSRLFKKITGNKYFGRQLIERVYAIDSFKKLTEANGLKILSWRPYQTDIGIRKNGKTIIKLLSKKLVPSRFCNHHVFICQNLNERV